MHYSLSIIWPRPFNVSVSLHLCSNTFSNIPAVTHSDFGVAFFGAILLFSILQCFFNFPHYDHFRCSFSNCCVSDWRIESFSIESIPMCRIERLLLTGPNQMEASKCSGAREWVNECVYILLKRDEPVTKQPNEQQ